jgi:hypothetical protein
MQAPTAESLQQVAAQDRIARAIEREYATQNPAPLKSILPPGDSRSRRSWVGSPPHQAPADHQDRQRHLHRTLV